MSCKQILEALPKIKKKKTKIKPVEKPKADKTVGSLIVLAFNLAGYVAGGLVWPPKRKSRHHPKRFKTRFPRFCAESQSYKFTFWPGSTFYQCVCVPRVCLCVCATLESENPVQSQSQSEAHSVRAAAESEFACKPHISVPVAIETATWPNCHPNNIRLSSRSSI